MRKTEINNYRFVRGNEVAKSEQGVKKLKSLKNPAIEAFYLKSNLDRLICMLNTGIASRRNFDNANPCTAMQQVRNGQLTLPPREEEMLAELKTLFPTADVQQAIINTKSQILIVALAWWGNKVRETWKAMFGREPEGVFINELRPRMVA